MLKQRVNKKTGKKEWALVSTSDPSKILKWFGGRKPSDEAVAKEEKRVQYFKHTKGALAAALRMAMNPPPTRTPAPGPKAQPKVDKAKGPDQIGAGVLFLCQGRILLIQRAPGEPEARMWDIPGGSVQGDDLWKNAKREVKEEVGGLPPGMVFAVRRHRYLSPATELNRQSANIEYTTFLVELPPGAMKWKPTLSPEHSRYRWCNKREALGLNLLPRVEKVLKSHIWDSAAVSVQPGSPGYIWAGSLTRALRRVARADKLVSASCSKLFDLMAKDHRYARLEAADTVYRGADSESVAGIYGAFKPPVEEQGLRYFTLSVGARGPKVRALVVIRDSRVRRLAVATNIQVLFDWVTDTLEKI